MGFDRGHRIDWHHNVPDADFDPSLTVQELTADTSTITAELKTATHPLAVLFGSLPAGSITGTPKKRAVEIISELEGAPRGAYCGTLGYRNFDGSGQWNVLIRTLQANTLSNHKLGKKERLVSLWAGGGITVASDCDAEYQECLDKVGNLLGVLTQDNSDK